jgi:hypothetical protein
MKKTKLIACLVAFVMILTLIPTMVFAVEIQNNAGFTFTSEHFSSGQSIIVERVDGAPIDTAFYNILMQELSRGITDNALSLIRGYDHELTIAIVNPSLSRTMQHDRFVDIIRSSTLRSTCGRETVMGLTFVSGWIRHHNNGTTTGVGNPMVSTDFHKPGWSVSISNVQGFFTPSGRGVTMTGAHNVTTMRSVQDIPLQTRYFPRVTVSQLFQ